MKKQLTLHKMCVTILLCGPWADLFPFYGLYCKRFSVHIMVYQGVCVWGVVGWEVGGGNTIVFHLSFLTHSACQYDVT